MSTKLDLHTHTKGSGAGQDDGVSTAEEIIAHVLKRDAIDGLVVTGHHRTYTPEAIKVVEGLRKAGRRAFFGAEYSSGDGHVLVFGCDVEALKLGMYAPLTVVASRAEALGGIAIPSHPHADRSRKSIRGQFHRFEKALTAIEGINGGHQRSRDTQKDLGAQAEAKPLGWGLTGGSDGHHAEHIGCVWTEFESTIRTDFELVRALRAGAMRPVLDEARIAELRKSGSSYYGAGSGGSSRGVWEPLVVKGSGGSGRRKSSSSRRSYEPEEREFGYTVPFDFAPARTTGTAEGRRCPKCAARWTGGLFCPSCYNVPSDDGYEAQGAAEEEGPAEAEAERIRSGLGDFFRTRS